MNSDGIAAATGLVGLTAPFWLAHIDPFYKLIIALLGLIVLALTIWNKWLEIKIKRARLKEVEYDKTEAQ